MGAFYAGMTDKLPENQIGEAIRATTDQWPAPTDWSGRDVSALTVHRSSWAVGAA